MNQQLLEQIVKEVMASMEGSTVTKPQENTTNVKGNTVNAKQDYPLANKRPELLKSPTGKTLEDITLQGVLNGDIKASDVRISPETLELQAQIAESVGRDAFAKNLRRAAELIAVPDDRILEIYNALRPYRSTKKELFDIADELETKYSAKINSAFIKEAAEVYQLRNRLRQE
ncbi:diol dehydratase small subunit [Alkaliphilus peptidifermentans]|uniref:Propanediol dehydratase small subunit n=1 Tax=Alkaliphilus peptidifermentans DSM 18978 TaxID=1120976 RepID=A0A1G5AB63_9FIRM|nr:diol dehydratase small subunit [Alkaliphilus peptidifermentans]SCX75125.1 propanediol dehydratase small subunit [Alkaliphilus peptidifermentans DSM 18978]